MSTSIPSTPTGAFSPPIGGPPGSADLAAECKKLAKLCGELQAERDKLRGELAQMSLQYEACKKSLLHQWCKEFKPEDYDLEKGLANLDEKPTLRELIAELASRPE